MIFLAGQRLYRNFWLKDGAVCAWNVLMQSDVLVVSWQKRISYINGVSNVYGTVSEYLSSDVSKVKQRRLPADEGGTRLDGRL
jgi:hypothetical protein